MTLYQVTAWCAFPHYTSFEVEADSFDAALAKAEAQVKDEVPESCDGAAYEWNELEIAGGEGEHFRRLSPERAAEIAAPSLLDTLRGGVIAAQDVIDRWERGDLAEAVRGLAAWLTEAAAVLREATATTGEAP